MICANQPTPLNDGDMSGMMLRALSRVLEAVFFPNVPGVDRAGDDEQSADSVAITGR